MDSVDRTAVTPSKSRLARTFAKVLHIRAVTGVAPFNGIQKANLQEKFKQDHTFDRLQSCDNKLCNRVNLEAFLAKLFACISTVKAAYVQLQFAQSPYDADGIQAADHMVVSELKNLSELKQCYIKKQFDELSPVTAHLLAELQEQKSLLKTYEITGKNLDSQLKLKSSEITFLEEKLEEANRENKLLEKRLNSSGLLSVLNKLQFSSLSPNHFSGVLHQTTKSTRKFVRLIVNEMELAGWDLDAAANAIVPGANYWNPSHKSFAFESFVYREMFDGFNHPYFSPKGSLPDQPTQQQQFFDRFRELKSLKTVEYLNQKPKSRFAKFCTAKYMRVVHPKMESSLFGNLNQRNLLSSGKHPETTLYATFAEMAKGVWLLHCLAFSFQPEASIFQVSKRSRFSEVYMESVCEEAFMSCDGTIQTDPLVAFTVVPGFKIGKTLIQCQVYLSPS
ncbi:hypothetical protein NMG60_11036944 [Bertholletia excelsa]